MIRAISDIVHFTIDKEFNTDHTFADGTVIQKTIIGVGEPGAELHHVTEHGIVHSVPGRVSSEFEMELLPGDKIYFHYHTVDEDNKAVVDGKSFYRVYYDQIFCAVRDGKIIMLSDHALLQPVMEDESACKTASGLWIKAKPDPVPNRAKVCHLPNLEDMDLEVGDEIFYEKDSDIPLVVEGEDYYRMRLRDIAVKY